MARLVWLYAPAFYQRAIGTAAKRVHRVHDLAFSVVL